MEVLAVISAQFLSVILLSDFDDRSILGTARTTSVVDQGRSPLFSKFYTFPQAVTHAFAEYPEPSKGGSDFDDTGHTYRAFLPFTTETEQTQLRRYSGPALLTDQQVVCLSPSVTGMRIADDEYWEGNITWEDYPSLLADGAPESGRFRCLLPPPRSNYTTVCLVGLSSQGSVLKDALVPPPARDAVVPQTDLFTTSAQTILTIQFLQPELAPEGATLDLPGVIGPWDFLANPKWVRSEGPWTILGNSTRDAVKLSACIVGLGMDYYYNVSMARPVDGCESTVELLALPTSDSDAAWTEPDDRMSNTTEARQQLGAVRHAGSPEQRGLLQLNPRH